MDQPYRAPTARVADVGRAAARPPLVWVIAGLAVVWSGVAFVGLMWLVVGEIRLGRMSLPLYIYPYMYAGPTLQLVAGLLLFKGRRTALPFAAGFLLHQVAAVGIFAQAAEQGSWSFAYHQVSPTVALYWAGLTLAVLYIIHLGKRGYLK